MREFGRSYPTDNEGSVYLIALVLAEARAGYTLEDFASPSAPQAPQEAPPTLEDSK